MVTSGWTAWVAPTTRAVRPSLVAAAAVALLVVVAASVAGASEVALPTVHVWLALAALAVAAATPHDPAASLLAALPTGVGRRAIHRAAIGTVAALGAWVLAGWSVDALVSLPPADVVIGGSVSALLALVAVAVVGGARFGPWGACTPLMSVGAGHVLADAGPISDALRLWWTHPWTVISITLAVAFVHHRTAAR